MARKSLITDSYISSQKLSIPDIFVFEGRSSESVGNDFFTGVVEMLSNATAAATVPTEPQSLSLLYNTAGNAALEC